ncbi:ABC transporter ATP-binding protein, partial [Bacteroidota bacterium]
MLKIKDLTKKFDSFTAVNRISLNISTGDLYGFLGPNGAGKTTTIKMIVGLYKPTSGSIIIDRINAINDHVRAKKRFGYIPDQPFLYDKLTGREFLIFCGRLYNLEKKILNNTINRISEILQIGDWISNRIEQYSQGMKQRITIASAILHNPKLLIIDEPMIGLDPQSAHIIKELFKELTSKGTS